MSPEWVGDRSTLFVVGDQIFADRRNVGELRGSDEHIAANVLASRLKMLVAEGMVTRTDRSAQKQNPTKRVMEKASDLSGHR